MKTSKAIKKTVKKSVKTPFKEKKLHSHKKSGFTLVEILVVIAIIGVLATTVMSSVDLTPIDDAENSVGKSLATITQNITKHMESNQDYVKLNAFTNTLQPICNVGVTGADALAAGCIDLASNIVPVYIKKFPVVDGFETAPTNGLYGCLVNGSVKITSESNYTGCGDHGGGTSVAIASSIVSSSSVISSSSAPIDVVAPTLVSTSPTDDAVNVAVGANISLTFSEPVISGLGSLSIRRSSDNTLFTTIAASAASGLGTTTVTFNPVSDLASSTSYYVLVDNNAFSDATFNQFSGIASATTFNFTTAGGGGDVTPPLLVSTSPLDNAVGVGLNDNLVMTFNESIVKGTGNIGIYRTSDNSLFESIPVTDTRVTVVGSVVTINPTGTFAQGTGYYVLVAATALRDSSANAYAGISSSTAWSFTTTSSYATCNAAMHNVYCTANGRFYIDSPSCHAECVGGPCLGIACVDAAI